MAEHLHSDGGVVLTLTYRPNPDGTDPQAAIMLKPKDYQQFLTRLRRRGDRRGFTVRSIAVGEHGTLGGRCHFHAALFWTGTGFPDLPDKDGTTRQLWDAWPHGHVVADEVTPRSLRYILKYILKDVAPPQRKGGRVTNPKHAEPPWFSHSKRPPLGHEFFKALARRYAHAGLAPRDWSYTIAGIKDRDVPVKINDKVHGHRHERFWLYGKSREHFIDEWKAAWRRYHGSRPWPVSDLTEAWADAEVASGTAYGWDRFYAAFAEKQRSSWWANELPVTKFRWTARPGVGIARTLAGTWVQREWCQHSGDLIRERRVDTFAQMRDALRGALPFLPCHEVLAQPEADPADVAP